MTRPSSCRATASVPGSVPLHDGEFSSGLIRDHDRLDWIMRGRACSFRIVQKSEGRLFRLAEAREVQAHLILCSLTAALNVEVKLGHLSHSSSARRSGSSSNDSPRTFRVALSTPRPLGGNQQTQA